MRVKLILIFLLGTFGLSNAGVFDGRYPSARATAMSEAYVAVANDVWAGYYNPAGLARYQGYGVASAFQRPFNLSFFTNAFFAGAVTLPKHFGSVSLAMETFGVRYNGAQVSSENTFTVSHGFYLMRDVHSFLSFGYSLKYYYWDLGESVGGLKLGSAGTMGLDVGLQASIYNRTYVGVYAYNINAPTIGAQTSEELPQRIVIGAAYIPVTGLTTTIAFDKTVGFDTQVQGGFEFKPIYWLSLRLGASSDPNRFSAGLGLNYRGFNVDYSFQTHPVLQETHKFSLIYHFGN